MVTLFFHNFFSFLNKIKITVKVSKIVVYTTITLLSGVQGIGWWLEEANIAQISLNLTDMDLTPMHVAYEEVKNDFKAIFVKVLTLKHKVKF